MKSEIHNNYICCLCKRSGVKLWRISCSSFIELTCATCSQTKEKTNHEIAQDGTRIYFQDIRSDRIGNRVPALLDQTDGMYWSYGNIPEKAYEEWKNLPL